MKLVNVVIPAFQPDEIILDTVDAILGQSLPAGITIWLTIVDDGSNEQKIFSRLRDLHLPNLTILRLPKNLGRACARNSGVRALASDYVWFIDADCVPANKDVLAAHFLTLSRGADGSIGTAASHGSGFWARYQDEVVRRRSETSADPSSQTTANFVVKYQTFERINGFCENYTHYGFEDRDFLLSLAKSGSIIKISPQAVALHLGELSIQAVCRKLREAARFGAPIFMLRHPNEYKKLNYARVDARIHGGVFRLLVNTFVFPLVPAVLKLSIRLVENPSIPYSLQKYAAKIAFTTSYIAGSLDKRY